MVLHTIIGEYDILYAQERELSGYGENTAPQAVMSTDPRDFLAGTELPKKRVMKSAKPVNTKITNK